MDCSFVEWRFCGVEDFVEGVSWSGGLGNGVEVFGVKLWTVVSVELEV